MVQNLEKKQKLRKYEGMFLLDNREVKKGWDYAKNLPLAVLERLGVKIESARRWDERRLAYEIKKQRRATYLLVYLEADPGSIPTITRELGLTDGVLRFLLLALEEFPELAFEPVDDDVDVSKVLIGDEEPEREKEKDKEKEEKQETPEDAKDKPEDGDAPQAEAPEQKEEEAPAVTAEVPAAEAAPEASPEVETASEEKPEEE